MDLSFWLTTLTLLALAYAVGTWANSTYIAPRRAARAAQSVKSKPRIKGFRKRSRVQNVPNLQNAGSAQQSAKDPPANVPPNVPSSAGDPAPAAAHVAPAGVLQITPNELQQLAEAIAARAGGATLDEAILKGFGLKKGGGPSYKRARELFDTATKAP